MQLNENSDRIYIGIDVGASGCAFAANPGRGEIIKVLRFDSLPVEMFGTLKIQQFPVGWFDDLGDARIVAEIVSGKGGFFRKGTVKSQDYSAERLGQMMGNATAAYQWIVDSGLPIRKVPALGWKKPYNLIGASDASVLSLARKYFPGAAEIPNPSKPGRFLKFDHNVADAALLSALGVRWDWSVHEKIAA